MRRKKILVVFGTRPEALKLAPVIRVLERCKSFMTRTCLTGQHREMVDQVLRLFRLRTDYDLNLMQKDQTLSSLTARLFPKMDEVLQSAKPDLILVQGDTTTSFAVALKAFYSKIPVGHVEAGLRTFDKYQPFPEEINRVLISRLADYHFAPTRKACENLAAEGVPRERIYRTGNTVVDALDMIRPGLARQTLPVLRRIRPGNKVILMTAHRRESFGEPMVRICRAVKEVLARSPGVEVIYPVHLNPNVQAVVRRELGGVERVHLTEPVSYRDILILMERCDFVLTDSGGIQEEAPSFGKPVLVMREVSERNEGVEMGVAKIVGTDRAGIVRESLRLLTDSRAYRRMVGKKNPYGDGKASQRIVAILRKEKFG
ncbi:MAG: UDP-N-acetylglucosamine 2-epimerase (non-hydrolyzing) [Candidatus Omnitrophota bacterium]|jgi:UDP-N-acetylglucosamine 2-epimerase (non-hydrolysing)